MRRESGGGQKGRTVAMGTGGQGGRALAAEKLGSWGNAHEHFDETFASLGLLGIEVGIRGPDQRYKLFLLSPSHRWLRQYW